MSFFDLRTRQPLLDRQRPTQASNTRLHRPALNMSAATVEKATEVTVHDVTDALEFTSISQSADEKPTTNDTASASAAEGRRLYIGNLAYATTEEELRALFKNYIVENVSIPKNPRTDRPVGYAFVDLSTPSEAQGAIGELSGKDVLGRKASVQLARKPETSGDRPDLTNGEGNGSEPSRRRPLVRGRGRGRVRGGRTIRGGRFGDSADERKEGEQTDNFTSEAEGASAKPEDSFDMQPLKDITNQAKPDVNSKFSKTQARPHRDRRERGPPADGIPSKNKVMVANLCYDCTEDKLRELFNDYGCHSAKIALRPIPRFMIKKLQARGEARKGRGFGFVTLASEEEQLRAVAEMNGKEVDGREIAVKVAIDNPDKTDEEANGPQGDVINHPENEIEALSTATMAA